MKENVSGCFFLNTVYSACECTKWHGSSSVVQANALPDCALPTIAWVILSR